MKRSTRGESQGGVRHRVLECALVWLVFLFASGGPPPGVNEPHYLGKCKHFWNPEWCADDLFLSSADAHGVFFTCFGWVTLWCSLTTTAWIGRAACWALLAIGWQRLSWEFVPRRYVALGSAAVWVVLVDCTQIAGEWVIGGVEAKCIAYALVLLGVTAFVKGGRMAAWMWFGLAALFHVLVGGWAAISAACAAITSPGKNRSKAKVGRWVFAGLMLVTLMSTPTWLEGLALDRETDVETVRESRQIYTYFRLRHHLDLAAFPMRQVLARVALLLVWCALCIVERGDDRLQRLRGMTGASTVLAGVGCLLSVIGWYAPEWAAGLLRLYWFRLADVMVPLVVSVEIARILFSPESNTGAVLRRGFVPGLAVCTVLLISVGAVVGMRDWWIDLRWRPEGVHQRAYADWRDACDWIAEQTEPSAVFVTPVDAPSFLWYAGRAEVVSWKNFPQDAASIVEWKRRVDGLLAARQQDEGAANERGVAPSDASDSYGDASGAAVSAFAREYGADYVVWGTRLPLALPVVYQNNSYCVYDVDAAAGDE